MCNSHNHGIQLNPYILKWVNATGLPQSFDIRTCDRDDCLGNFWNIGTSLASLSTVEQVSLQGCDHPFARKYWQSPKNAVNDVDANDVKNICNKILPFTDEPEDDHFPMFAEALSEITSNAPGCSPFPDYDIHVFWSDAEAKAALQSIQNDPDKSKLLSELKIHICLESDPKYLTGLDGTMPKPAVVPIGSNIEEFGILKETKFFHNHICFMVPDNDNEGIFVNSRRLNSPTFWIPGTKEELLDLIWLYIDFYFLRWRYLELWEHYLTEIQHESYEKASRYLKLGIMNPVAVINEQECDTSFVVHSKIQFKWHKEIPSLSVPEKDQPIDLIASCPGHQVSSAEADDGAGLFEIPTGLSDIGESFPVSFEIPDGVGAENNLFIFQRNGKFIRRGKYSIAVQVEDDGNAAEISIFYDRQESHNGRWCFPSEEKITASYKVKPQRNGTWSKTKDPVTFSVNGKTVEAPYLIPEDEDVLTIKATSKSGKSDSITIYRLPRANAIFQNCDQVGTDACAISFEGEKLALSSKASGKRVNSIRCAQNAEFAFEARGVVQDDTSLEVWNKNCEFLLFDSNNSPADQNAWDLTQQGDDSVIIRIKRPGNYSFITRSKDVPTVEHTVQFSVFADHSKIAFRVLLATFALCLISTLAWYGLNFWVGILYLACPLTLLYIFTHREGCIRNKKQNALFLLASLGYLLIIFKVILEELH